MALGCWGGGSLTGARCEAWLLRGTGLSCWTTLTKCISGETQEDRKAQRAALFEDLSPTIMLNPRTKAAGDLLRLAALPTQGFGAILAQDFGAQLTQCFRVLPIKAPEP